MQLDIEVKRESSSRKSRVEHKWYDHIIHRETDSRIRKVIELEIGWKREKGRKTKSRKE